MITQIKEMKINNKMITAIIMIIMMIIMIMIIIIIMIIMKLKIILTSQLMIKINNKIYKWIKNKLKHINKVSTIKMKVFKIKMMNK